MTHQHALEAELRLEAQRFLGLKSNTFGAPEWGDFRTRRPHLLHVTPVLRHKADPDGFVHPDRDGEPMFRQPDPSVRPQKAAPRPQLPADRGQEHPKWAVWHAAQVNALVDKTPRRNRYVDRGPKVQANGVDPLAARAEQLRRMPEADRKLELEATQAELEADKIRRREMLAALDRPLFPGFQPRGRDRKPFLGR